MLICVVYIYTRTRFIIDRECVYFVGISIIFMGFRIIVKNAYLLSVRPSVRMCQCGSHCMDFREILYRGHL